ncbi:hypothetical protein EJB05_01259 [Eragrostis curvula]|uniref:Uncharacterized protein n=1 Tax=Eragrostis curvula TaxID=38414 RepID=A0A5J9WPS8_9POAL|nr:hypothetical protein EJB05_01259 [Eragrostis curvula]
MQDGVLSSYDGDFPTDFSSSSTRSVRRRLSIRSDGEASASSRLSVPSNDVSQPDGASSLQLCRKRKSSALEASRRISRRLKEPSYSTFDEDENEQLPSTMAASSTGHRRRLCDHTRR